MGDCLTGLASSISSDLVKAGVHELRYPCCFNNLVEDLQNQKDKLIATRNSVNDRVEHAKKQQQKTAEVVDAWLKQANTLIDNVEELLKKARTNKNCCFGHFPNWICRYRLGRKFVREKEDVEKCIEEGSKYIQLERIASLPGMPDSPSEKCLKFDSRQSAYEELMEAVKDDEVSMIGLYGMGGCGKTTLALELKKTAEAEHLFDKVLFVPVSSTVQVPRIQDKIASALQFKFPENEEPERAQRLCIRLTQEKRILVILDDVWEKLNFGVIGIPSRENHKGCKVLITTRSKEVCTVMDCQRKIQLLILTDEEAWALFQKQAHISEGSPNVIKHLARQISNECKGLPVAIAAVASTLKGKAEDNWKVALDRLTNSKPVNIEKGLQNPYKCLQLSYDNLDIEEAKSLFLLCSVFPEDSEIPMEDVTRIAIGLGLVGEVGSYEGARNEVSAAKNKLISSCLLLDVGKRGKRECVKMHDLVRDVAHWIAKNENKAIKCALEKAVKVEDSSTRYLWCEEFPLDCSNLELLRITTDLDVSDEIFEGMGRLRVLFLFSTGYRKSLSMMSFKSCTNLRCLSLKGWELGDISFIGDMKRLESLTLKYCSFLELPSDVVVTQQTNLRLVDLSDCHMERNPFEVIGRHPQLEELYIYDSRSKWDSYNEKYVEFFKKFSVSALQRYQIHLVDREIFHYPIGEVSNWHRALFLSCFDISDAAVMYLAKKAEALGIGTIQGGGAKNIIPDIFEIEGGMNELIHLCIGDSKDIECLVDTSNHLSQVGTFFSMLLTLRIIRMEYLGALFRGRLPTSGLFEKLEELHIYKCPKLTSLFTLAVARSLVQLGQLTISSCDGLKHIVAYDDTEEISTDDHRLLFPKLEVLQVSGCDQMEYIIPVAFAQGLQQLESLEISSCHGLKHIVAYDDTEEISTDDHRLLFPKLKHLQVDYCNQMEYIIPVTFAQGLQQLESLEISSCHGLKHIVAYDDTEEISTDDHRLLFPKLKHLQVEYCNQMEYIIPVTFAQGLQQLESLEISSCHGLKHIVAYDDTEEISTDDHRLLFPKLKRLHVLGCNQMEYIIPVIYAQGLQQLESLQITKVDSEMKYVFGQCTHGDQSQNELKIDLPALEKLELDGLPNMISVFPENCHAMWPSLRQFDLRFCPKFDINNFMAGSKVGKQSDLSTTKGLQFLKLKYLPQMTYISVGSKNSFTFQNLQTLEIIGCEKLEVIFPASVVRCLPELKSLTISECEELKQIIEEDMENQKLANPCFPKLAALLVHKCHKLKRLISVSASNDLPNIELLIINGASELEELIGCEQGQGDEIGGKVKVELPKLKVLIFNQLTSLCQGIELQTVRHRVVHNCPKLSLTSTTTLLKLRDNLLGLNRDFEITGLGPWELLNIVYEVTIDFPDDLEAQGASASESPSSQINEELAKEFVGKVLGSEIPAIATSPTDSELIQRPSPSPLDIPLRKTHTHELEDGQSMSAPCLMNQQKPLEETESTIEIPQSTEETQTAIIGKDPTSIKPAIPTSGSELSPSPTSLATPLHKIPSHSTEDTQSTEDIVKESIQEGSSSEEVIKATLSPDLDKGVSLDGVLATPTESSGGDMLVQDSQVVEQGDKPNEGDTRALPCQKIQNGDDSIQNGYKQDEIGVVSNDSSIEVPPDTRRSHSLIIAELGAFKHFVDLDDAQIALIAEAKIVYPHLWNVCDMFSERFQAWRLKTLADMLLFLRNESAISVTPEREKKFHRLCNEAVQLGFERSWVDEMRQRVKVRDPMVDHAQARLSELTQELGKIKGEINSLNDFLDSQKKYFNFL